MYRFEFYNNLDKFKANSLQHNSEYGKKHYQKIDNYYGPGKTRYFWSKEEWDAYQNEKQAMYEKAKADVAKRDAYNKNMQAAKAESREKEVNSSGEKQRREERRKIAEETIRRRNAEIKDNLDREIARIKRQEELKANLEKAQNARKMEEQKSFWNNKNEETKAWDKEYKDGKDINDALVNAIWKTLPTGKESEIRKEIQEYLDIGDDKNWRVSKKGQLYYVGDNTKEIDKKIDEGWEAFEEWQNSEDNNDQANKWDIVQKKNYDAQKMDREDRLKENKTYNDAIFKFIYNDLDKDTRKNMAIALKYEWNDLKKNFNADPSLVKALEDFINEYTSNFSNKKEIKS